MFSDFADKKRKSAFKNGQFLFSDPQYSVTKLHVLEKDNVPTNQVSKKISNIDIEKVLDGED